MKYLKSLFSKINKKNIRVETFDCEQMEKLIYGSDGTPQDKTIFDRIRFFSSEDFKWISNDNKPYYSVLFDKDKIIAVAKIGYYSMNSEHENDYSISFFSIDIEYRNNGLSHLLADELFRFAKEKGLDIRTSTYTYVGYLKIKPLFNKYSEKHGVKFLDRDDSSLMDAEWMYDKNLIHRNEREG